MAGPVFARSTTSLLPQHQLQKTAAKSVAKEEAVVVSLYQSSRMAYSSESHHPQLNMSKYLKIVISELQNSNKYIIYIYIYILYIYIYNIYIIIYNIYIYIRYRIKYQICEQIDPCSGLIPFDCSTGCAGSAGQRHCMAFGERSFSSRMT